MKQLKEDISEAKEEIEDLRISYGIIDLYKEIISDLKKASRRNFIVIIVLLIMLFATNIGWLLYESQFETVTEDSLKSIELEQTDVENSNQSGVIN